MLKEIAKIKEKTQTTNSNRDGDFCVREGVVKNPYIENDEIKYEVEVVFNSSQRFIIKCSRIFKFGGLFNYEEYTDHGYTSANEPYMDTYPSSVKAGDRVAVVFMYGDMNQGLIIGALGHGGRMLEYGFDKGSSYEYMFNGLNVKINNLGEYTVTFNGAPTNTTDLDKPTTGKLYPTAKYNTVIGGSFFKFKSDGSWEVNDASLEKSQSITIDKSKGQMTFKSGNVYMVFDKKEEQILTLCKKINSVVDDAITYVTQDFKVIATTSSSLVSPKIALGTSKIELLDQITKLIEAMGTLIIMTPQGPASAVNTAQNWSDVIKIQEDINKIKGKI